MDASTENALPFSLNKIAPLLGQYERPAGPFDPEDAWQHLYAIHTLAGGGFARLGEVSVARQPAGAGAQLDVLISRHAVAGHSHYAQGTLTVGDGPLSTPTGWHWTSKMATAPDAPAYLLSGQETAATVVAGGVTLTTGGHSKTLALPGAWTCRFCLYDAVQRLAQSGSDATIPFDQLDDFDQPLPGQTLGRWKSAEVSLNGVSERLTAFRQIGPGVIPTIYWTDSSHRLLFVLTGVEMHILAQANGVAIPYQSRPAQPKERNRKNG